VPRSSERQSAKSRFLPDVPHHLRGRSCISASPQRGPRNFYHGLASLWGRFESAPGFRPALAAHRGL